MRRGRVVFASVDWPQIGTNATGLHVVSFPAMTDDQAISPVDAGGQGVEVLSPADLAHQRADCRLTATAVRRRWKIGPAKRDTIVTSMMSVLEADADPRNVVAAAKVLVQMVAQNQADEHLADKNARLDEGKATENIAGVQYTIVEAAKPTQ